jgi:hypothetical protein
VRENSLAKRKRQAGKGKGAGKSAPATPRESMGDMLPPIADDAQLGTSSLSLHELFGQQTMEMLDRADLDEEQKQTILVAMSCPCCGAGGLSFTTKLKRKS